MIESRLTTLAISVVEHCVAFFGSVVVASSVVVVIRMISAILSSSWVLGVSLLGASDRVDTPKREPLPPLRESKA